MPPKDPFARRRHSNVQSPFKTGDKIRAIASFGHHGYEPGRCYTVTSVDRNDNTLKARDSTGSGGNWIKWCDCQKTNGIGWDWLKTILPAEALDLLAAFDGLENLELREDLRNRLVLQIPGLHDKILLTMADEEAQVPASIEKTEKLDGLINYEDLD